MMPYHDIKGFISLMKNKKHAKPLFTSVDSNAAQNKSLLGYKVTPT